VKTKYPKEFEAFKKCLDDNDYKFYDCRRKEMALNACWNADFATNKDFFNEE